MSDPHIGVAFDWPIGNQPSLGVRTLQAWGNRITIAAAPGGREEILGRNRPGIGGRPYNDGANGTTAGGGDGFGDGATITAGGAAPRGRPTGDRVERRPPRLHHLPEVALRLPLRQL